MRRGSASRSNGARLSGVVAWATVAALVTAESAGAGAQPVAPDPPPAPPRTISVVVTGDTLMHSPLVRRAQLPGGGYDFTPMFAEIAPLVAGADLAICHLETPVAPPGEALSTAPLYGVPPEVVTALAQIGFDRCSTASNHVLDRGAAGIDATLAAFDAVGMTQSGMARTPAEIEPQVIAVAGVRIAHLSYTFSFNGLVPPAGEEWRSALIDPARILADAALARQRGAEVVMVSLHWGHEGQAEVTPAQRALAEQLTADGSIDLIVGHHAHVLQPIELINDRWVIFGLGNLVSNMPAGERWPAASQDAAVVSVPITVDAHGVVGVELPVVWPTWVDRDAGWIVRDVGRTINDPATGAGLRAVLDRSLDRTEVVMGPFIAPSPSAAPPGA